METLFLSPLTIIIIASIVGFFMAYGIGANDVANAMGTSVGSKALTLKQAIIIAAIFEFLGAYFGGGEVTSTIRKGIVDPTIYEDANKFIIGMLSSLLAAGTWLIVASRRGWPVSTTHSIVGAIIGFVSISKGMSYVSWGTVGGIASSWVTSPVIAGLLAFLIYLSAKKSILDSTNPGRRAINIIPIYSFYVAFIISLVIARKGLKNIGLELSESDVYVFSSIFGIIAAAVTYIVLRQNFSKIKKNGIESAFAILMVVSACAMAFAHGSNDVANGIGPMAAVISIVDSGGEVVQKSDLPIWILFVGGLGIVIGLSTLGYRVMLTIGTKITELVPTRGFSAELAAAATVVIASRTGIPVSTTQIAVGAVMGVGLARGIGALDLRVIGGIMMSWVITLPVGAILSIFFFFFFRGIFL